jgi:N-acetylglucosamine-6-phosphate deacetylase
VTPREPPSEEVRRIAGGTVLTPDGWRESDVVLDAGVVSRLEPGSRGPSHASDLDAAELLVVPGFVDLQINGAYGHDFTSRPESIWEVGAMLPRHGVTAFLPTVISCPGPIVRRAAAVLAKGAPREYRGARPLGLHCEGPMLAPSRRGVHPLEHLRAPSPEVIEGWTREAGIRLVTIAPELPRAETVIRTLSDAGTVVSAGHSEATFEEARRCFALGVSMGTHLFNAMSGFHHQDPGLAAALLADPDVPAGIIVDGDHVHPGAVAAAWRAKGPDGLALVSDATAALGMAEGSYSLGDATVDVRAGGARSPEGVVAGSLVALDEAVRNLRAFTGCTPAEAVLAASATPVRILGEGRLGRLEPGAWADIDLLSDELDVTATLVGGRLVFDARTGQGR